MKKALTMLALLALVLLAGCGGRTDNTRPPSDPGPVRNEVKNDPEPVRPADTPETRPEEIPPADTEPAEAQPPEAPPEETPPADTKPEEAQPAETRPEDAEPADTEPAEPAPEPAPEPTPDPEPAETVPEDGTYTANVILEGGTGRAAVESPAVLRCEDGKFWATIVWSSSNFDYMKVDGEKYPQINTEGNSVFEIPVTAFDRKLDVIADTVAMSEPHEVEYILTFDSASLTKQ